MEEFLDSLNSIPAFLLAIFGFIIVGFAKKIIDEDLVRKHAYDNIIIKLFNKVRFKGYSVEEAINYLHNDLDYCVLPDDFKYCLYTKDYGSLESIIYIKYLQSKKTKKHMNIRYISFIDPYINSFSSTVFFLVFMTLFIMTLLWSTLTIAGSMVNVLILKGKTYLIYMILCLSFCISIFSIVFVFEKFIKMFSKKNKDIPIEDIKTSINAYNQKYQEYKDDGFNIKLDINTDQLP